MLDLEVSALGGKKDQFIIIIGHAQTVGEVFADLMSSATELPAANLFVILYKFV